MMGFEEMVLGAVGVGLFSTMLYYNLLIMNNLKKHEELSLTMFFLDSQGPLMFQLAVSATVIYSIGMLYAALAIPYNAPLLNLYSKVTSVVLFVILTMFVRHIAIITSKRHVEK